MLEYKDMLSWKMQKKPKKPRPTFRDISDWI